MCLSTVYIRSGGRQEQLMQDVARMKAKDEGFVLINLFGEQRFVQGKIKSLDFIDNHSVVIEKTPRDSD